jgi:hypothetical protein
MRANCQHTWGAYDKDALDTSTNKEAHSPEERIRFAILKSPTVQLKVLIGVSCILQLCFVTCLEKNKYFDQHLTGVV